ncbi:MAG: pilus assembly protein [Planctomycetota bacterium]|nr:MAG: pilus assembly protein [Planctomycetota bacterium]
MWNPKWLSILEKEEGNAIAEMTVLLSLYLLMTYGLFFMGQVGIAQIGIQKAVRYAAWNLKQKDRGSSHLRTFPYPNASNPSLNVTYNTVPMFQVQDLKNNGGARDAGLAAKLLNGFDNKGFFQFSQARATFRFTPLGVNFGAVELKAYHALHLQVFNERTEKPSSSDLRRAIEEILGSL